MAAQRKARRVWTRAFGSGRGSTRLCRAFVLAAALACLGLFSFAVPLLLADQRPGAFSAQRRSLSLSLGLVAVKGLGDLGRLLDSAPGLRRSHVRGRPGGGAGAEQAAEAETESPCTLPDGSNCAPEVTAAGPPESVMAGRGLSAEDATLLRAAASAAAGAGKIAVPSRNGVGMRVTQEARAGSVGETRAEAAAGALKGARSGISTRGAPVQSWHFCSSPGALCRSLHCGNVSLRCAIHRKPFRQPCSPCHSLSHAARPSLPPTSAFPPSHLSLSLPAS